MTRLTRDIRESIVKNAVKMSFQEEDDKLQKKENELALACYKVVFDKDVLKSVNKLPKLWFRWDNCLRFNCDGWDIRLCLSEAVAVPFSNSCSRLGTITGELAQTVQKFSQDKKDFQERCNAAHRHTRTLLESVNSIKRLKEVWPEGKPFYQGYDEEVHGKNLPAIPVARVNEILGLKAAA